jgi:fumarate hydratase class II
MHISTIHNINKLLLPSLEKMRLLLLAKSEEWAPVIKVGRTHMQDATPITLGQEFSGYAAAVEYGIEVIKTNLTGLYQIAQGGTAVGTGLNTHPEFAKQFANQLQKLTGEPFCSASNKFLALSTSCAIMQMSSCLSTIATILNKIANDIRLLGSGPRCGLGELILPENEPGSSIMPGKINPTQCEALTMICTQVLGNHTSVCIAASNGHLELNVYRPLLIYNILQSIRLLSDGANSFTYNCLKDLKINETRIQEFNERSLMIVAALNPYIGYDNAAKIAKEAYKYNISLKEAAVKLQILTAQDYDKYIDIKKMV